MRTIDGYIREDTAMSKDTASVPRFKTTLTWGGIIVAFLGMVLLGAGSFASGLLLVVAGMICWLFAKRRSRVAEAH
jgi:hypothetical protein